MPTIKENQLFTPIIEFEVAPELQDALLDALANEIEQRLKYCAGFVSASLHASEDGRRVLNYTQWTSQEAWTASNSNANDSSNQEDSSPGVLEAVQRCEAARAACTIDFFKVARVVEKPKTDQTL